MRAERVLQRRTAPWFLLLAVALILLGLVATAIWLVPLPPRVVVMSTGAPGSDYQRFAAHYQTILRRSGIELRLMPSAGGVENLRRLNDPGSGVMIGFAQGGLTSEAESPDLQSLGTMFFEPFWCFSRIPAGPHLEGLRGKRISIGPEGSGTRALAIQILALNGIDRNIAELQPLSPEQASDALLHGDIDAAALVTSWNTPAVQRLLAASDVDIVPFPRADTYAALYPYFSKLVLPAGVGNIATNRPATDVSVIAPKASLIVRRDLHPAIQYLLLEAAAEIHSEPSIFRQSAQFPTAERGDVPLSAHARHFYQTGTPFLQRYLPFWLAILVSSVLIPAAVIAYPLLRLLPDGYMWSMRRRILWMYGELKLIEIELDAGADKTEALAKLQRLQKRAMQIRVPLECLHLLYGLRAHLESTQARLSQNTPQTKAGASDRSIGGG